MSVVVDMQYTEKFVGIHMQCADVCRCTKNSSVVDTCSSIRVLVFSILVLKSVVVHKQSTGNSVVAHKPYKISM